MRVAESRLGRGLRWEVPTDKNATQEDNLPSVEAQTPPNGQSVPPEDDSFKSIEWGPEDAVEAPSPPEDAVPPPPNGESGHQKMQ